MISFNNLYNYKTIELFRIELSFISIFTALLMLTKEDDPSRTTSNDNIKIILK